MYFKCIAALILWPVALLCCVTFSEQQFRSVICQWSPVDNMWY